MRQIPVGVSLHGRHWWVTCFAVCIAGAFSGFPGLSVFSGLSSFQGSMAEPVAMGGEIGFVEDFALAPDRAAALKQLVPGTDEYYY